MATFTLEGKYISTTPYFKMIVEVPWDTFKTLKNKFGGDGDGVYVPISNGSHPRIQITMPKRLRDEKMMPNLMACATYKFRVHLRPWKFEDKSGYLLMFDGVYLIP